MEICGEKIHELCLLFPFMEDRVMEALITDIDKHGQRDTIKRYKGSIIDGKNRLRACHILERKPNIEDLPDDTNIIAYIKSTNLCRRDLTPAQRIIISKKLEDYRKETEDDLAKETEITKDKKMKALLNHNTIKRIAKSANSKPETVEKFNEIEEKAQEDPKIARELQKAIKGKTTIEQVHKKIQPKTKKIKQIGKTKTPEEPTVDDLKSTIRELKSQLAYYRERMSVMIDKFKALGVWEEIKLEVFPIVEKGDPIYPTVEELRKAELI